MVTAKQEKQVGAIIKEIAVLTRKRISALDLEVRDLAWATVACGIVSAAIHDCEDARAIVGMVEAAVEMKHALRFEKDPGTWQAFMGLEQLDQELTADPELRPAYEELINRWKRKHHVP